MDNTERNGAKVWGVRAVACLALALVCAGCGRSDDQTRLRQALDAFAQAVEARDPGQAMEQVATDFTGNEGMDRAALHNLLRAQVLANTAPHVVLGPVAITVSGDTATARFTALATGGQGDWLPERAGRWQVTTGWRRDGRHWLLYYAQWEPASP